MDPWSTVSGVPHPANAVNIPSARENSHPTEHESSWRSKFPKFSVGILSVTEMVFTIIIFILEITSLAIDPTFHPTGVGIWCGIPFIVASILTLILVIKKDGSRVWATRAFIAQLVLIIFTFVLIGITGNVVSAYSSFVDGVDSSYVGLRNYKITQAQLAFGILLMFSGLFYVVIYIFVTYMALWKPYNTLDTEHLFSK